MTLIGGHTEVTYDLPRPVAVGAMLGEVDKDRAVLTSGARPGDSIVLTKGVPVEGTALLAREASGALAKADVEPEVIKRAEGFLFDPGISVVRDAAIACEAVDVHAMHDPTEGGVATGLLEIARGGRSRPARRQRQGPGTARGRARLLRPGSRPPRADSIRLLARHRGGRGRPDADRGSGCGRHRRV